MGLSQDEYGEYVRLFNDRDYDRLCDVFFSEDVVLEAHGFALRGKKRFRDFYTVFHEYVEETVVLKKFYEGEDSSIAEVEIQFFGKKSLTPEVMISRGLPAGPPVEKGSSISIRYLISYDKPDQFITRIRTAVIEPVVE